MISSITKGIQVSVKTRYRSEYSDPYKKNFLFSYTIRIENHSDQTVKLLRRHWMIFDSCGELREVEGEGVVGLQPVLAPGASHEYESACNLSTEMGRMSGTYLFENQSTGTEFRVTIPDFEMYVPYILN